MRRGVFKGFRSMVTKKKQKMDRQSGQIECADLNLNQVYTKEELQVLAVDASLNSNLGHIKLILGGNADFVKREFEFGQERPIPAAIIFIENLIKPDLLDSQIMQPMLQSSLNDSSGNEILNRLTNGGVVFRAQMEEVDNFHDVVTKILSGDVALFVEGYSRAFIFSSKGYKMREVSEPSSENTVRGPRDSFIEVMSVNIGLIRQRLVTPNLVVEKINIGRIGDNKVTITYIKGLASEGLVAEVRQRLSRIEIDAVLESGYLEHLIQDSVNSPFPQVGTTERPDRVVGGLLEGRVAIFTDNTPFVLIVPGELMSLLQTSEDYYWRYYVGTFIRWLRYVSFFLALVLPSLYIAITNYHQEMIPTTLFISIATARQGVPFPAIVEALMMEVTFEVLREASVRLPRSIGQTISIAGALVIGQSAVQAGIVSPLMVIIVAFTGIASFTVPQYSLGISVRLLRFPMMLSAAFLGLFGVMVSLVAILIHLCSLRSFGVPYLSPLAPLHPEGFTDTLVMAPHWSRTKRPRELVQRNRQRLARYLKPQPPEKGSNGGGH